MKGQPVTVIFNVLAFLVIVASAFGFGDFQPDAKIAEWAAAAVTLINLYLRLRPLPPEKEGFR